MASQYNVEPQPTAKVILNTTSGDLTLELFAKQTPLAARNFLQHCLDGYYNNTVFHRLVSGFILQGGDPTGTGEGGISAVNNGEPFEDEFHSRLKFNRRGLLGMANEGKDNNTSQFFFTLAATPELQYKNTMFGRIEDDTIYNLMKMAEGDVAEGTERPLYPVRITGAEIVINPFPDMVARVREAPRTKTEDKKDVKKRKKPMGKNKMSFEDDEEVVLPVAKKSKVNQKLVAVAEEQVQEPAPVPKPAKIAARRAPSAKQKQRTPPPQRSETVSADESDDDDVIRARDAARQAALDKTNAEIAAMKASMKRGGEKVEQVKEKPMSALEAMIPATSKKGRKKGKAQDEPGALDIFNAFKSKLDGMPAIDVVEKTLDNTTEGAAEAGEIAEDDGQLCDLHFIVNCQSCKAWDQDDAAEDDDDDDPTAWMSHKLTFAKDTLGKDLEWRKKMEEFEVIDPLEQKKSKDQPRDRKR